MKRLTAVLSAVALSAIIPPSASAQSSSAFAGWVGLMVTPAGALPPVAGSRGGGALVARYGRWQFDEGDDETSNFGVGFRFGAGRGRVMINLGMTRVADCDDCGGVFAGFEHEIPVSESSVGGGNTLGVAVNSALGLAKPTEGDGTAQSLSVSLPITLSLSSGGAQTVTPFLTPGLGYGRISGGGDSEGGVRTMLGGGITVSGLGILEITASFRKVFMEEAPTVYGLAIGFGR